MIIATVNRMLIVNGVVEIRARAGHATPPFEMAVRSSRGRGGVAVAAAVAHDAFPYESFMEDGEVAPRRFLWAL